MVGIVDFQEAKTILSKTIGEEFTFWADFVNETIQELNLNQVAKILDVGTGWGIMTIILALNGFNVLTGEPESSREGNNHGEHHRGFSDWRKSAKAVGVENKIKYQQLDAEDLPFPDKSFDAVFMLDTLQHIEKKRIALKECLRVFKSKGILCVIELNKNGLKYCQTEFGFTPDFIVPMAFLKDEKFSVEVITGRLTNAYVLSKS